MPRVRSDLTFVGFHVHGRERWQLADGRMLVGVHRFTDCIDQAVCVIHEPTDHHMRDWPLDIDEPGGLVVRQCEHELWHPDPDSLAYFELRRGLHECDGCCHV